MSPTTEPNIMDGYCAGTWQIDPAASHIEFSIRMLFGRVRGHFNDFTVALETGTTPTESSATSTIDLASIDTGNAKRDEHLRGPGILETNGRTNAVDYRSTDIDVVGGHVIVNGQLTIHDATSSVPLALDGYEFSTGLDGSTTAVFVATGRLSRRQLGIRVPGACGGVVVSDKVNVLVRLQARLQPAPQ